mgnify:FL=1
MNKTIWDQCAEMWELPIEEVSALERKYYNYTNSDECQLWETAKKILNQHEHRKQIEAQKAAESEARLATLEKCVTIMNEWREKGAVEDDQKLIPTWTYNGYHFYSDSRGRGVKVGDWLEHILTADAKLDAIMQMESEII